MLIPEDLKEYAERVTGLRRSGTGKAPKLVQVRKPHIVRFKDDGLVPNHPRWPLILYRSGVRFDDRYDSAAVIEDLFERNGWREGIYDYVHYHSRIHEVLGIARGFLVVGAYPPAGIYDECTTVEDRPRALKTIPKVPMPRKDPVYGARGSLSQLWKKAK